MKKFLSCLVAAVATLAMVSCGNSNNNDGNKPKDPNADATITLAFSNVTATTADCKTTVSNPDLTYVLFTIPAAGFNEQFGSMSDEEIIAFVVDYIEEEIAFYAQYGYTLSVDDYLISGNLSETFDELNPETDYSPFAAFLDTEYKSCNNKVFKGSFKTGALQHVDMTFDCRIDTANNTLYINPSLANQDYLLVGYDKDTLATFNVTPTEAAQQLLTYFAQNGALAQFTVKGNQTINLEEEVYGWEERAGTFNFMYMMGAIQGANFISDVFVYEFTCTVTGGTASAPRLVSVKRLNNAVSFNKHALVIK